MKHTHSEIISGVIVPTLTFYYEGGLCPEKPNTLLIDHIMKNGADALFLMGSTGEGLYFKDKPDRKSEYLKFMKEHIEKNYPTVPVVIGIYGNNPQEVIGDGLNVLDVWQGIHGFVVPPPTDSTLSEPEQYEFYSSILKDLKKPIYLYNNPNTFGGTSLSANVLKRLKQEFSHLHGIKDSSAKIEQKETYLELLEERFGVSCGKEGMVGKFYTLIPVSLRRYAGIVPSISNIVNSCRNIVDNAINGNDEEVLRLQAWLNGFRNRLYDSRVSKGKAQRGLKHAFSVLYGDLLSEIPQYVMPSLQLELNDEVKRMIEDEVQKRIEEGEINLVR